MAIAVRGIAQTGSKNNGSDVTLTFDVITPPLEDDLVVVFGGHGIAVTTLADPGSGYTKIDVHTGSAPIFGAWYKFMGATPDLSVVCSGGGNSADGVAYACWVFSGVDTTTPLDQTTITVGPTTSADPDCGSITTQTVNAFVLAMAGGDVRDTAPGTVSGYVNQFNEDGNDTNDITIAGATFDNPEADAEDPGAWSSWASSTWYAITAALKPATGDVTLTAGVANLVLGTAIAATLVAGSVTLAAAAQPLVVAAPTAVSVPGSISLSAGAQRLVVVAPLASATATSTLPAGAQRVVCLAPLATAAAGAVTLAASEQPCVVVAPTVTLVPGAVTRAAGEQACIVSAPTAILTAAAALFHRNQIVMRPHIAVKNASNW